MEYAIETNNLTKQYGTSTVVNNLNLHVPKGTIYGLLGRNGAGKTTVMKMILQLVKPTAGTIRLFGTDFRKNGLGIYKKIGSIIETPGFYHNLTAYENLRILGRLRRQKNETEIRKALEIAGLQKEYKKLFGDYSLGMKQRLGIAAAIMHEPELLILDEPINGLDPIGISEIRRLISALSRDKGTTILISSHDLSEIEQTANFIGVMHEGSLIEEVNMAELHKRKRKYIEFELSDTTIALNLLKSKYQITNCLVHGNTIKIFDCTYNLGEINRTFVENGLLVTKIGQNEENLEDYFSKLIGGGGIA
ncbi:MAG TPA: bacitracin ABC transporter ATP-binding protein [Firmicutes bacterium]|nr:bacitracin ABC transporter ATP-binding protein [Bacillota bacterium]